MISSDVQSLGIGKVKMVMEHLYLQFLFGKLNYFKFLSFSFLFFGY